MENSNRKQNKQTKNTTFLKYYKDQMKKCKATSTPKQAKYSQVYGRWLYNFSYAHQMLLCSLPLCLAGNLLTYLVHLSLLALQMQAYKQLN